LNDALARDERFQRFCLENEAARADTVAHRDTHESTDFESAILSLECGFDFESTLPCA